MTHPRECARCAAVLDYIEMQILHLETLISCTALDHGQMRARQRELREVEQVVCGQAVEMARWTQPSRARAYKDKEKADG